MHNPDKHVVVARTAGRRICVIDSSRYIDERNREHDVVVVASFFGVVPARLMSRYSPRAVIGHDAGIGMDGAGIQGLYYLEALGTPAASAAGDSAELGNGIDLYTGGMISRANILAEQCGVERGMAVRDAANLLMRNEAGPHAYENTKRRKVVDESPLGRKVVVLDSIIHALPEDRRRNVVVAAGHTGTSGGEFAVEFEPWGFITSDGGRAKNDSGIVGLEIAQRHGIAGATVDARTAAIGDGFSSYFDGTISARNALAAARGVEVGMRAAEAARCLMAEQLFDTAMSPTDLPQRLSE